MASRPVLLASFADSAGVFGRVRPVAYVLGAYGTVGVGATVIALALGRDPLACDGWLGTHGSSSLLLSLGAGLCVAAATIAATRTMVRHTAWARALHTALRPTVHRANVPTLWALATASAVGEELLFRGLLVPILGVALSSLVFGALHQIRGLARWGWMVWATVMGLVLGGLYAATGSLAGPVLAHALINAYNLRFLRDNDPAPRPRSLGGLLRRG